MLVDTSIDTPQKIRDQFLVASLYIVNDHLKVWYDPSDLIV